MKARRLSWTSRNLDKLIKIQGIISELSEYLPLTLRQIYYQLVGGGIIENNKSEYTQLSRLLKYARLDGKIEWSVIEDRVRAFRDLRGWADRGEFIESETNNFLDGYRRDLLSNQKKYIEIWIEKDALSSLFVRTASPYCVPVMVCRGFTSISVLNDYRERIREVQDTGRSITMLYFGDFDPSGMEMLSAMKKNLNDEMGIEGMEYKRIALSKGDITRYKLPHQPEAIKAKDTRTGKHLARYGALAVELDALPPAVLVKKIKDSIEAEIDLELYHREMEIYEDELERIGDLRERVIDYIGRTV